MIVEFVYCFVILNFAAFAIVRGWQHTRQVRDLMNCLIAKDAGELKMLRTAPRGAVKRDANEKRNSQPVDPVLGSDY